MQGYDYHLPISLEYIENDLLMHGLITVKSYLQNNALEYYQTNQCTTPSKHWMVEASSVTIVKLWHLKSQK